MYFSKKGKASGDWLLFVAGVIADMMILFCVGFLIGYIVSWGSWFCCQILLGGS